MGRKTETGGPFPGGGLFLRQCLYVALANLELSGTIRLTLIFLPLLPECWD